MSETVLVIHIYQKFLVSYSSGIKAFCLTVWLKHWRQANFITGLFLSLRKQQNKVSAPFLRLSKRTLHTHELDLR